MEALFNEQVRVCPLCEGNRTAPMVITVVVVRDRGNRVPLSAPRVCPCACPQCGGEGYRRMPVPS